MKTRLNFLATLTYLSLLSVTGWYGWLMVVNPGRYSARRYDNPRMQELMEEAVKKGDIFVDAQGVAQLRLDSDMPAWLRQAFFRYRDKGHIRARDGRIVVEENLARRYNPYSARRQGLFLRGPILDRKGRPLAWTEVENFRPRRQWGDSEGSAAYFHALGLPGTRFATYGVERVCNETLGSRRQPIRDWLRAFFMQRVEGKPVWTALDAHLQEAAYLALKETGHDGAAVVIDLATDEILVATCVPSMPLDSEDRDWFAAFDQGMNCLLYTSDAADE